MSALVYLTFFENGFIGQGNYVLAGISMLMFILGLFVAWEGFKVLKNKR